MADTFSDLPDALVRDLLALALPTAEAVRNHVTVIQEQAAEYRKHGLETNLILRKSDLDVTREPSVVGVDGSYQIHRLTSLDLCAAASVAVEGTTREARRYWPEPYHLMWVSNLPHAQETTGVLRGLMVSMELHLASEAPHDVVLLDGSFGSLLIYLNQGLGSIDSAPEEVSDELLRRWTSDAIFEKLQNLLRSDRVVAVPKYTSRNELMDFAGFAPDARIDGRTLATVFLEPGEYTRPLPIYEQDSPYHVPTRFATEAHQTRMNEALKEVRVIYFRPYRWLSALRLELPFPIWNSPVRLSLALEGIMRQIFSPAVQEPYPLFLADRMVKSLGSGVSVIEQTVAQHVVDGAINPELSMLFLQNHRTEGGRGGV